MTTSELFKTIREKLGNISQAELARRLEIEKQHVNRYEKGTSIGFDLLCEYLRKLNLTLVEILT